MNSKPWHIGQMVYWVEGISQLRRGHIRYITDRGYVVRSKRPKFPMIEEVSIPEDSAIKLFDDLTACKAYALDQILHRYKENTDKIINTTDEWRQCQKIK